MARNLPIRLCVFFLILLLIPKPGHAERIRVGAILPLSGDAASLGEACRNGMTLALEEGGTEFAEVTFEDDRNTPMSTVSAFHKLFGKADLLLSWSSATSNAIAPLSERKQIPLIAIASDPKIVQDRTHVVTYWVSPDVEAKVLIDEMQRRNISKIARLTTSHDGTIAIKQSFDRVNKSVEILFDEEVMPDSKDFRPLLLKIKRFNEVQGEVQGIFANLYFGSVGLFARQAREAGILVPLLNIESFEDPGAVASSNGALLNQWYVTGGDPKSEFIKRYNDRFPGASILTAGNCYDSVMMLRSAKRESVNSHLHSIRDFEGSFGVVSATGDNRFSLPAVAKIVTKSGFELSPGN